MNRRLLIVAVVAVVCLAGCAAPVANHEPTPTETAERGATADEPDETEGVDVRGGSLPFDGNRTYERIQAVLGTSFEPPVVYVEEPAGSSTDVYRNPASFLAVMGVGLPDPADSRDDLGVGGLTNQFGTVYVLPAEDAASGDIEATLAHEFVHVAQFERGVPRQARAEIPVEHRDTTDGMLAHRSTIEGAATYSASAYVERYDLGVAPEDAVLEDLYPNASSGTRMIWGPYFHGSRYVDERADSPADHWSVYDDPPVTMREVLHGGQASTTALEPFDVRVDSADANWESRGRDVMGEFVLRQVLGTELSDDRSADGAAGWEYDRRVDFANAEAPIDGYAWTIRFTDGANATAAEDALAAYLDSRAETATVAGRSVDGAVDDGNRTRAVWRTDEYAYSLVAVDERTVTVLAGAEAFVESATVESSDGAVRVVVSSETGESASRARATERPVAAARNAPLVPA